MENNRESTTHLIDPVMANTACRLLNQHHNEKRKKSFYEYFRVAKPPRKSCWECKHYNGHMGFGDMTDSCKTCNQYLCNYEEV